MNILTDNELNKVCSLIKETIEDKASNLTSITCIDVSYKFDYNENCYQFITKLNGNIYYDSDQYLYIKHDDVNSFIAFIPLYIDKLLYSYSIGYILTI